MVAEMTREEFRALPYLLTPAQAVCCGYTYNTLMKYADYGVLVVVLPPGCRQRRFQKRQFAQMLGWEDTLDWPGWRKEKPLLSLAAIHQWTGYDPTTVRQIVRAGGLSPICPGGMGETKYRKSEVAQWLGFESASNEKNQTAHVSV
jgi:hypothetical protein